MSIMFGGDPESFMDPPRMENKSLSETLGFSPIAAFLDLIGVHRQVAKEPKDKKKPEDSQKEQTPPAAVAPSVLTEVENALAPKESAITPTDSDAPITPWGIRWLESNKPLLRVDPNDFLQ